MKKIFIPEHIRFLVAVYLTGLAFFTFFRLILFLTNLDQMSSLPEYRISLLLKAFLMGFRFDTVVSCYILLVPFLVLSAASFVNGLDLSRLIKWVSLYLGLSYSIGFCICSVDIPFFNHFYARISTAVFSWMNSPGFMFKLVFQEIRYWIFIIPFILSVISFWLLLNRIRKKIRGLNTAVPISKKLYFYLNRSVFFIIFSVILFAGIRGRLAVKSPIRVGTAYFSSYAFPNQLGLNPVFTLMRSLLDDLAHETPQLQMMADERAIKLVKEYLNIPNKTDYPSPIAREVITTGTPLGVNVVLVIMESMSAEFMSRYGNPHGLTPFLDRLARLSYTFDNIYTSGTHTYSGIYSTLFSFPVLMRKNPLKQVSMLAFNGLSNTLKRQGYQTIYFTTHDDQFDNIGGFLRANGFQRIISEKDYPSARVLSTLGVPDDYMFEVAIPLINRLNDNNHPFLAVFLTASNHTPYIVPENIAFKPRSHKMKYRVVEYSDWALGKFMELAAHQKWFGNTLFVFVADSGTYIKSRYDMPLCFFHTPLIIYGPGLLKKPRIIKKIGGQIDIFPTIMGILNISYINNTLGIDLLKENRPYIYFCGDDKMGCLNHDYFLVMRNNGHQSLYHYRDLDNRDYLQINKGLASRMKSYCGSMLQTTQWMIRNQKVGFHFH